MKTLTRLLTVCACVALTPAAHASLIGDDVVASISNLGGFTWTPANATVGAGIEYTLVLTNVTLTADLGDDTLTITAQNTSVFNDVTFSPTFLFDDLDWVGMSGSIVGLTELANTFDDLNTPATLLTSFTANSITVSSLNINTDSGEFASVTYGIITAVDAPSTLWLVLAASLLAPLGTRRA